MLFHSILSGNVDLRDYLMCFGSAAACGLIISLCYMFKNRYSKNFVSTLILLPIIVSSVIMMVNGNVGTGVAVLGAFSLIRFRSVPGNSKDISAIFLSMAVGLATGMGYIGFAFLITVAVCIIMILLSTINFGGSKENTMELRITVPEDLDFEGAFDDILKANTLTYTLRSTKTTNMGSLFELRYDIILKPDAGTKKMIDDIRTRNGNLTVSCSRPVALQEEL
ncbi:MAG: DUF4956 domain-containing protein [Oscillospiraceae bacterium]|nr:DUF4956 domain-containing protein [Oscillospiraceae bacterium]